MPKTTTKGSTTFSFLDSAPIANDPKSNNGSVANAATDQKKTASTWLFVANEKTSNVSKIAKYEMCTAQDFIARKPGQFVSLEYTQRKVADPLGIGRQGSAKGRPKLGIKLEK